MYQFKRRNGRGNRWDGVWFMTLNTSQIRDSLLNSPRRRPKTINLWRIYIVVNTPSHRISSKSIQQRFMKHFIRTINRNSQVQGFSSCTKDKFQQEEQSGSYPCLLDYPSTVCKYLVPISYIKHLHNFIQKKTGW